MSVGRGQYSHKIIDDPKTAGGRPFNCSPPQKFEAEQNPFGGPSNYGGWVEWFAWMSAACKEIERVNIANGWKAKGEKRHPLVIGMLIVTEIAELAEAFRAGPEMPSEHIPEFSNIIEETADAMIRLMDFAAEYGFADTLGRAIATKVQYNATRGYKHGGKTA